MRSISWALSRSDLSLDLADDSNEDVSNDELPEKSRFAIYRFRGLRNYGETWNVAEWTHPEKKMSAVIIRV